MSTTACSVISDILKAIGIEYGFMTYNKKPIRYPYFVGEYTETEPYTEDGMEESEFLLTGFTRDTWLSLEEAKNKIKKQFDPITGRCGITDDGGAIAVFYAGSRPVPTGDAELKRIEITLKIKEWKVN